MTIPRKNILWISQFVPYPPKVGMLLRSYNLLRETAKHHNVHLIAFVQSKPLITMLGSLENGLKESRDELDTFCKHVEFINLPSENRRWGNYRLAFSSLFSSLPYTVNWMLSNEMDESVRKLSKTQSFDYVHFDTIGLAPYLKHFPSTAKTLTHHNIESHMMLRRVSSEKNLAKKIYYWIEGTKLQRYEKRQCKKFYQNITCSRLDSDRLRKIDPQLNIIEIPNGVDIDYFKPLNQETKPNSLVFAGGLNWYPNIAAVLFFVKEVWPRLKFRCPEVVIDIIGQDPPEELKAQARSDKNFRVHGFVDDVRPYIDKASVYICPINDGGGTKLKILDALAMEKAVVAHEIACEGIEVRNNVSIQFAESGEQYAEKIINLFENPEIGKRMGTAGRELICNNYSYQSIGKKLARIFS